jgi:hypothetical protein
LSLQDSLYTLTSEEVRMNWLENTATSDSIQLRDRRCDVRTKVSKHIRIRHLSEQRAEEQGMLIDLSRDGLCFTSRFRHYRVGMELQVMFPESRSACSVEVVRTERLPNGRLEIGVRILEW